MLCTEAAERALAIATRGVAHAVRTGAVLPVDPASEPPALQELGASFVTIRCQGALRGCTGRIEPTHPLASDIARNAHSAALCDPRFAPVAVSELGTLSVSVSVLEPMERLHVASRAELIQRARPGRDGLMVVDGSHRAVLLPQVWQSLPEAAAFVDALWNKAKLHNDWSDQRMVFRFAAQKLEPA